MPTGRLTPVLIPCSWFGRAVRGQPDLLDRVEVLRRRHTAGHPEVVGEVAGPDEQHVDPVDRGDLLRLRDGPRGLDLHDAEYLVVGSVERTRVQAEAAGPVVRRDPPVAVRRAARIVEVPDRRADLL